MRDLFLSFRSFFKRVADFVRYRNATRDMNARYPDATPEEVAREDVCIICREEMRPAPQQNDADGPPQRASPMAERMRPKKLPCGHILHFSCLRSWLERQQNCPTCRRPVLVTQRIQLQAGNGPALARNAIEQPGGAALPGHMADQAGRNRARVINFGPLRIGFGAGGGNLINDLAQRIHNGEQRQPAEAPGNAGGQQHFGFGFGFGRRPNPRNQNPVAASTAPIQTQLEQVERSIQQQISSLQVASNELHLIRMLNNELFRLRNLQATAANGEPAFPQMPVTAPASLPLLSQGQLPQAASHLPPTVLSSHSQRPLSFDSGALPEGMTLPPGWTLMPLQRYDGPQRVVTNDSSAAVSAHANSDTYSAAQARHTPPEIHSSAGSSNHIPPRSPSRATTSNGTHLASREMSPPTSHQANATLPSWNSDSRQVNGEHLADQTRDAIPLTNGQANSDEAASSTDKAEGATEKGKSKAATVEELVDDVD
jgi:E3 ubiquitin-protein ligase synoviolin